MKEAIEKKSFTAAFAGGEAFCIKWVNVITDAFVNVVASYSLIGERIYRVDFVNVKPNEVDLFNILTTQFQKELKIAVLRSKLIVTVNGDYQYPKIGYKKQGKQVLYVSSQYKANSLTKCDYTFNYEYEVPVYAPIVHSAKVNRGHVEVLDAVNKIRYVFSNYAHVESVLKIQVGQVGLASRKNVMLLNRYLVRLLGTQEEINVVGTQY
jgi:hypothetical protein